MILLRPAEHADIESLHRQLERSRAETVGMVSLPATRDGLAARIDASTSALCRLAQGEAPTDVVTPVLFVLTSGDDIIGVTGCTIDRGSPLVVLRITLDDATDGLAVRLMVERPPRVELGSTFLVPAARGRGVGALLSKSRLVWLALVREHVPGLLMSHIRGRIDARGRAPMWDAFGRAGRAAEMSAAAAIDHAERVGRLAFLADLVGTTIPVAAAEAAGIGAPHPDSLPAYRLLNRDGLRPNGMFDPFDGGPTLVAHADDTETVRRLGRPWVTAASDAGFLRAIVARPDIAGFRAAATDIDLAADVAAVPGDVLSGLSLTPGAAPLVSVLDTRLRPASPIAEQGAA